MQASTWTDFRTSVASRRDILRFGAAGVFGLTAAGLFAESRAARKVRAHSVIFLHQWGGPAQHESFDMKPNAPPEVRNIFKPVPSNVTGVGVCELLPAMAKVMDKVCLIRTMTHTMKNHNSAGYYSLSGHAPATDDQRLRDSVDLFPAYGSVVDRFAPSGNGVPTFVAYPHVIRDGSVTPGQHASFLGKLYNPLLVTQSPNSPSFGLPELSLPAGLSPDRMADRREMLNLLDRQSHLLELSAAAQGQDQTFQRAVSLLASAKVKTAFDLSREPAAIRDSYGRTTYGQGCLLARRLVEAGVRFVNVYFSESIGGERGGWDVHGFDSKPMNPILKNWLLPVTNQTLPTLLRDLDDRGLLATTLVVWVGEFGRTPRINATAGRDHWPQCYTALLAGGGVKRGHVHGVSDKIGAFPVQDPVTPDDLAATIFDLMGIDPATEVRDTLNRPLPIANGRPVQGVMA